METQQILQLMKRIKKKKLKYGQNIRSSEHLKIYEKKPFNKEDMKNI
jgi:hypothetical protein